MHNPTSEVTNASVAGVGAWPARRRGLCVTPPHPGSRLGLEHPSLRCGEPKRLA